MAKRSLTGTPHPSAIRKKTSIGNGRRKLGSFRSRKKYRGQGK
jgi:hypothetical protein